MGEVQELVGIVPWTFIAQIVNLFLTVFLVKKFLFKRVNAILEKRKELADAQILDAEKLKAEAETMKADYEASIGNAQEEARAIVTAAQKNAADRSDRMLIEAKEEAAAIKAQAEADIERERESAFAQMKGEIGDIAVSIAGKVIGREVTEEDHRKLIDDFLSDVGETT